MPNDQQLTVDLPRGTTEKDLLALPMERIEQMIKTGGDELTAARGQCDWERVQALAAILNSWKQLRLWRKEQDEKKAT